MSTSVGSMYVRESGSPDSAAIVFLHGVGLSGRMWDRHMAALGGYHCLAPDLPGFGRSNQLPWISLADTADRVAELIESRVPPRRAHVVGLSLGGAIAHTLLARRPQLLDRVVIDGCGVLPWWGTTLIKAGVAAVSPFLHTRAVIGIVGSVLGLDAETRADLRSASPRAFRRAFAEANSLRVSPEEIDAPCPTLLVAGEGEVKPPVRASNAALAALMGNAEARYAPGHGHGWVGKDPDLHRQMVTAWITGGDLPPGLLTETSSWDRAAVDRLVAEGP